MKYRLRAKIQAIYDNISFNRLANVLDLDTHVAIKVCGSIDTGCTWDRDRSGKRSA